MNTVQWLIIGYIVLDRIIVVCQIGKPITITPGAAVLTLITGFFLVWGVASL